MDESMTVKKFLSYYMPLLVIIIGWGISVQVRLAINETRVTAQEEKTENTDVLIKDLTKTQVDLTVAINTLNTYIEAKGL